MLSTEGHTAVALEGSTTSSAQAETAPMEGELGGGFPSSLGAAEALQESGVAVRSKERLDW